MAGLTTKLKRHDLVEFQSRTLTLGGMIIGAPGGKNGIVGIIGMCGGKDMSALYLLLLRDQ